MRFHFPLEGLLRVRRLLEVQARESLEKSMMRVAALESSVAEARRWTQETADLRAASQPLPAVELQYIECILQQTREAILQCERQKQAEEQRASELRASYLLARRDRKTVSTLRDNALKQFESEQARRRQSELDDYFLGKLLRERNAPQSGAGAEPKQNDDRNLT